MEWNIIKKFFPPDLLFVGATLVIKEPRILAHAIFFRMKAGISVAAFPEFFGDRDLLDLVIVRFVKNHLFDAMVAELKLHSPGTLQNADLSVFAKVRRNKNDAYADLYSTEHVNVPAHAPSDEMWAMVEEFVPLQLLERGGARREPRRFFHAIWWLLNEGVSRRALPGYFGGRDEFRLALRRFVRHGFWDGMADRLRYLFPEQCKKLDFGRWGHLARSKNPDPEFRRRRPKPVVLPVPAGTE
jgi:transposase